LANLIWTRRVAEDDNDEEGRRQRGEEESNKSKKKKRNKKAKVVARQYTRACLRLCRDVGAEDRPGRTIVR
jgi:hypothetical protein